MKEAKPIYTKTIKINEKRETATITIPKQIVTDYNLVDGDRLSIYRTDDLLTIHENTSKSTSNSSEIDTDNSVEYKQQVKDLTLQLETQSMKLIEFERLRTKEADYNKLLDLLVKYVDTELSQMIQLVISEVTTQHKTTITEAGLFKRLLNNIDLSVDTKVVDELEKETKNKLLETIRELKE